MRDLIITENVTLDGVAETEEDWFSTAPDDEQLSELNREHMSRADGVLLGRITYESYASYWPQQVDDVTGVSDYLNRTQKYVVSTTLGDPTWQNTTVLRGPLNADIHVLKDRPGKDIVLSGSLTLARALLAEGLLDEYRLFVYPVVRGHGRQLFEIAPAGPDADLRRMRLEENRATSSGVVLLRYRVP
jgi:dihydrofolate reductase